MQQLLPELQGQPEITRSQPSLKNPYTLSYPILRILFAFEKSRQHAHEERNTIPILCEVQISIKKGFHNENNLSFLADNRSTLLKFLKKIRKGCIEKWKGGEEVSDGEMPLGKLTIALEKAFIIREIRVSLTECFRHVKKKFCNA